MLKFPWVDIRDSQNDTISLLSFFDPGCRAFLLASLIYISRVADPMVDGMNMWPVLQANLSSPRQGFAYNIDKTGDIAAIRYCHYHNSTNKDMSICQTRMFNDLK